MKCLFKRFIHFFFKKNTGLLTQLLSFLVQSSPWSDRACGLFSYSHGSPPPFSLSASSEEQKPLGVRKSRLLVPLKGSPAPGAGEIPRFLEALQPGHGVYTTRLELKSSCVVGGGSGGALPPDSRRAGGACRRRMGGAPARHVGGACRCRMGGACRRVAGPAAPQVAGEESDAQPARRHLQELPTIINVLFRGSGVL